MLVRLPQTVPSALCMSSGTAFPVAFVFREHWRVSLIGEVFNLYNKANLTGYSGDLTSTGFGQPAGKATQVFGSGGPRAFQLAMKVNF